MPYIRGKVRKFSLHIPPEKRGTLLWEGVDEGGVWFRGMKRPSDDNRYFVSSGLSSSLSPLVSLFPNRSPPRLIGTCMGFWSAVLPCRDVVRSVAAGLCHGTAILDTNQRTGPKFAREFFLARAHPCMSRGRHNHRVQGECCVATFPSLSPPLCLSLSRLALPVVFTSPTSRMQHLHTPYMIVHDQLLGMNI